MKKLGFIGCGNMATAILSGITEKKVFPSKKIFVFDIDPKKKKSTAKKFKTQTTDSLAEIIQECDTFILAVKPQNMEAVCIDIQKHIGKTHTILSIAAGLDIPFYQKHFGEKARIVRLMPNTPALVGLGATGFYSVNVSPKEKKEVKKIFSSFGICLEVKKEHLLDSVTALSGSGPAFVYSFIQGLIEGGVQCGLSAEQAHQLAVQTLLGATTLFNESGESAESLIQKVASKGGTTEAGLKVLAEEQFKETIVACLERAYNRATELRKGMEI